MNKILKYSMGVLVGLLSALNCMAADKFDVLPDLPDPLSYAVQPAQAATVSGAADTTVLGAQSIGQEPSLISVVISLAFVIFLIYLTGIIYAKLNRSGLNLKRQQGDFAKSHVSVISTTQLGNNKTLHVVELDGKRMLIGASVGAIQLIKDLGSAENDGDDREYSHIEIPNIRIPRIEIPKIEIPGFSKIVTKTHKKVELEQSEQNMNINEEVSQIEEPISSDGIIDSLFTQNHSDIINDSPEPNEHVVDPDEFALYKKYLG